MGFAGLPRLWASGHQSIQSHSTTHSTLSIQQKQTNLFFLQSIKETKGAEMKANVNLLKWNGPAERAGPQP